MPQFLKFKRDMLCILSENCFIKYKRATVQRKHFGGCIFRHRTWIWLTDKSQSQFPRGLNQARRTLRQPGTSSRAALPGFRTRRNGWFIRFSVSGVTRPEMTPFLYLYKEQVELCISFYAFSPVIYGHFCRF